MSPWTHRRGFFVGAEFSHGGVAVRSGLCHRNTGGKQQRQSTDVCTSFNLEWYVVSPTFHFGQQKSIAGSMFAAKDIIKVKIQNRKSIIAPGVRKVLYNKRSLYSCSALTSTCCLYLNDSMPFFVDRTKKGCLSILVTWTSPPLLSMAPEWIAALQILDCWNHKSTSVGDTSGTRADANNKEWRDSPHRRKEFPTLSLSYSCNRQDIYTCRRRNESSC